MKICPICRLRRAKRKSSMCDACGASYDRTAHRDGSVIEAMLWAAKRAWRFANKRRRINEIFDRIRQSREAAGLLDGAEDDPL